ncbi:hypothetical protein [Halopiger xanaduensis]|uniref:Uncharacterized protein n=1 Tax=Halopiger xanaduensis (strain DSM 18323 / JCM 14033 / SH-6) TaxID=797210 RepID=F8D6I4_HALXS|nr:hypothetical protein [Halopiger xanaduensis]AEH36573.1 hypothetical protein Halxa_1946 [Halopiger xanaduensis SH-6]
MTDLLTDINAILEVFFPHIGSLVTIILSSLAGATAIILGRSLYQKRTLFAAIHMEMIDNYLKIKTMEDDLNEYEYENPMMVFQGQSPDTAAYEATKINDPNLYISLSFQCSKFSLIYDKLEYIFEYEEAANRNPHDSRIMLEEESHIIAENPDLVEEELKSQIKHLKSELETVILELEEYRMKNRYRKAILDTHVEFDPEAASESENSS